MILCRGQDPTDSCLTYGLILHTLIRHLILENDFETAYFKLGVQLFPCYESARLRNAPSVTNKQLIDLGRYLYKEVSWYGGATSCVSISTTIQAVLFAHGMDAELIIGGSKNDGKLFSHTWVQLSNGFEIDPSGERFGKIPLQKKSLLSAVGKWVNQTCASG